MSIIFCFVAILIATYFVALLDLVFMLTFVKYFGMQTKRKMISELDNALRSCGV